ncbi:MAG: hypothetical protein DSY47_01280 [Hydrogenothermus sp.]|nr:MAG: hypothetical protein DSY47_01280 [Hydrogenothermus sp.]
MPNINYIASAGTGKTHNLVCKVLEKILTEKVSLKNLLILTFTEKSATELKEKLYEKIKNILINPKVPEEDKKKLHKELIFIDSGYIGTFHSVFLRLLKKYPEQSKIDNSFNIISNNLDSFLDLIFEKWIEEDFEKNKNQKKQWHEIIKTFEGKSEKIKEIFIILYKNKLKLKPYEVNLEKQKQEIEILQNQLKELINELFKNYGNLLNEIKKEYNSKFFKVSPFDIRNALEEGKNINLPNINDFLFFKSPQKLKKDEKKFYESQIEPLKNDENFKKLEKQICEKTQKLKEKALDYNANILLKKFFEYLRFVKKLKDEEKLIDFNDILEKMLELIKNEDIKNKLKNNFKYIFIDEFQDTDIIQNQIIEKISNQNIYVFGDPKQCIYTWRDANLNTYYQFLDKNKFKDKVLDTNYRSSQILVEFFNKLLSSNTFLSHIDKKFKKSVKHKNKIQNSYIKLINLKTTKTKKEELIKQEALYTVKLIQDLLKENHKFSDIMILLRKNSQLKIFKETLAQYNIPVDSTLNNNLFEKEEIKTIINILKLIEYPRRQLILLKVLKSPLIFADDLFLYKNKENLSLENIQNENLKVIREIIENKYNLTVEEIIDEIYQKTDLLETYSLMLEGTKKVENLKKLKTIAKKKTLERLSLRDFILYMETNTHQEVEERFENAVKLLTMHKSKGLESKVVIIPLVSQEPWQIELNQIHIKNGKPLLYFPKNKTVSKKIKTYEKDLKEKIKNEQERLFYVAITRAKEKLIFIASGKPRTSSYKNLLNKTFKEVNYKINEEDVDFEKLQILPSERENLKKETENIQEKLKNIIKLEKERQEKYEQALQSQRFKSVSQIMKEHQKEEEVKIPLSQNKEENTAIYTGILVHDILESLDFNNFSLKKVEELLNKKKTIIPENIREIVLNNALKILQNFENSPLHNELRTSKILFRELPFTLYEENTYIEGRIDIVYEKNGRIIVMDYKTNKYESKEEKEKILSTYKKQKEYYLKAVSKLYPDKNIEFKLGLLYKCEIYPS